MLTAWMQLGREVLPHLRYARDLVAGAAIHCGMKGDLADNEADATRGRVWRRVPWQVSCRVSREAPPTLWRRVKRSRGKAGTAFAAA